MMSDARQKQQALQQPLPQQLQQQQRSLADSAEVYPYSANDAIRPNAPLPASISHPQSNISAFTQPTNTAATHPSHSQSTGGGGDGGLTSTSALLHTLVELSIDVKRMCVEDNGKTAGTGELATRMDELRAVLAEHTDLIFAHCSSNHLHTALLSLRTTLLSAHLILHKAVNTAFRRSHKFKQPIRITVNDTLIGLSKLTSAISLAVATSSSSSSASATAVSLPTVQLLDGQEEAVLGDKYYYGHGLPTDYAKALHLYTIAADKGYTPAMVSLGSMMREGVGRKKDTVGALSWYRKAAEGGNADAQALAGQMYEAGEGVVRNLETAIEYYQEAANGGHVESCASLGYIYEHGSEDVQTNSAHTLVHPVLCCPSPLLLLLAVIHRLLCYVCVGVSQELNYVPVDIDAAAAWYREAAEKGYAKAMNNLAYLHFIGSVNGKKEYEEAVRWFRQAAEQGNAGALNNLAIAYESGKGVERDEDMALQMYAEAAALGHVSAQSSLGYLYLKQRRFDVALDWLRKAADGADREAYYHLAQMYHHGLHVQRDDQHAYQLYNKAADAGHPYALLEVGHALFTGRGVKKDVDRAFVVYKQSAELGVSEAENSVGVMMEEGVGVLRDVKGAREWYEKAAGRGNGDACFNLGLMFDSGVCGDERDEQKALEWYKKAAAQGSQHAVKRLQQQEESKRRQVGYAAEGLTSPAGRTQSLPQVSASAMPQ